ncbi:MAG: bifunctional UDP-N-acetylglucosamine diphosphorylase/glucosamine-1-phosphate N-acetyltransferase GlmU [Candidatus Gastranaerophilaceae bacterium]|jgi:bifunctional UDP-N-acetylglucosamine pyrophosphorylase/glucosamine-1-phosphate N-acetyltransferase
MLDNEIKAVILAAGKGTRMKSSLPKVLHEIFQKTLLQRVIDSVLDSSNIQEIFVIVGHQAEDVSEHVKKNYDNNIKTILQEPQLGTGDAVFKAYDYLKDFKGTLLILCGDTPLIRTQTIEKFVQFHNQSTSDLTVMSAIFENPMNYGRIIRNEAGFLQKITEEKDASFEEKAVKEINAGIYCMKWEKIAPAFFELTTNNNQGEYYLTDIVDWTVKKGLKAQAFILEDNQEIFGINSRKHLAEATDFLNKRKLNELMDNGVTIIDPSSVWVSPETTIESDSIIYPGCYIDGKNQLGANNVIGPNTYINGNVTTSENVKILSSKVSDAQIATNSTIGPFAHIRDGVILKEKVRVGNFVEIKKSEINKNTNVAHLSYVGDASLGEDVNIGAGTITANYNALTKVKSKTVIENGVKIGSNSVLVAPVTIGERANIAAGSIITKDLPENALGITRSTLKIIENWVKVAEPL